MIVYFIAGMKPNQVKYEDLDSFGLGYAFDSSTIARGEVRTGGPDGGAGTIIGRENAVVEYVPRLQRWEQSATHETVWIGYPLDLKPESLIRPKWRGNPLCVESIPVTDSNDKTWSIPIAKAWSTNALPRAVQWNGKEFVVGEILPQFQRLEELGTKTLEFYLDNSWPDDYLLLCAEIVGLSYYIGPQEFASLGIVNTNAHSAMAIFEAVIDAVGLDERVKKNSQLKPDDSQLGSED